MPERSTRDSTQTAEPIRRDRYDRERELEAEVARLVREVADRDATIAEARKLLRRAWPYVDLTWGQADHKWLDDTTAWLASLDTESEGT